MDDPALFNMVPAETSRRMAAGQDTSHSKVTVIIVLRMFIGL